MVGTLVVAAGLALAPAAIAADDRNPDGWVGTWSASPQAAWNAVELKGQTIRQVVHASVGGTQVRVRLSNAYGAEALHIGAARVGLRSTGASIATSSDRVLTFNGAESTTIPVGAVVVSDPVHFRVPARGAVAVSIYVPGSALAATEHLVGLQTTYISPEGDFTGADTLPIATTTLSYYFLSGVDVRATTQARAIVTLGDSITDGFQSTPDANKRWPDRLAERLRAQRGGASIAVLNAGISGNRLLHDTVGTNASARLDRDVLVQTGARYLIVLAGINDIGIPVAPAADEIIAAHRQIITRARAMGLKVYGGTLTPFQAYLPGIYYNPDGEAKRQAINHWIRTSKAYDAVIDFDRALRDPANPAALRRAYDSGDNLHPNDAGYKAMADAIDLKLFSLRGTSRGVVKATNPATQAGKATQAPRVDALK